MIWRDNPIVRWSIQVYNRHTAPSQIFRPGLSASSRLFWCCGKDAFEGWRAFKRLYTRNTDPPALAGRLQVNYYLLRWKWSNLTTVRRCRYSQSRYLRFLFCLHSYLVSPPHWAELYRIPARDICPVWRLRLSTWIPEWKQSHWQTTPARSTFPASSRETMKWLRNWTASRKAQKPTCHSAAPLRCVWTSNSRLPDWLKKLK